MAIWQYEDLGNMTTMAMMVRMRIRMRMMGI